MKASAKPTPELLQCQRPACGGQVLLIEGDPTCLLCGRSPVRSTPRWLEHLRRAEQAFADVPLIRASEPSEADLKQRLRRRLRRNMNMGSNVALSAAQVEPFSRTRSKIDR